MSMDCNHEYIVKRHDGSCPKCAPAAVESVSVDLCRKHDHEYRRVITDKGPECPNCLLDTPTLPAVDLGKVEEALEWLGNKGRYECICFNCGYETERYIEIDEHPKEFGDMVRPWDVATNALTILRRGK